MIQDLWESGAIDGELPVKKRNMLERNPRKGRLQEKRPCNSAIQEKIKFLRISDLPNLFKSIVSFAGLRPATDNLTGLRKEPGQ